MRYWFPIFVCWVGFCSERMIILETICACAHLLIAIKPLQDLIQSLIQSFPVLSSEENCCFVHDKLTP